ncbi:MAG: DMT family transporter [Planctomycetota bacterium]
MPGWLLIGIIVVVGALSALQPGMNARMGTAAGSPWTAAIVNFFVGLILLFAFAIFTRAPIPQPSKLMAAPWWAWLGGVCGALLVGFALIAAPRLGAVVLVLALVAGQVIGSVIADQYGLVGFDKRPVSPVRLIGVALVVMGLLVTRLDSRSGQDAEGPDQPAETAG